MPEYDTDFRFDEVRLGVQVREFLASPVGTYLKARAQKTREEAQEALMTVAASDADTIRELQMQGRAAQLLMRWVEEAIESGNTSEQELYELESEHD